MFKDDPEEIQARDDQSSQNADSADEEQHYANLSNKDLKDCIDDALSRLG